MEKGHEILEQWSEGNGVVHQILHRRIVQNDPPNVVVCPRRGRLDILQDLTEQGVEWSLLTDPNLQPLSNLSIHWIRASFRVDRFRIMHKDFNDIRQAIDWIIEQICEKGS